METQTDEQQSAAATLAALQQSPHEKAVIADAEKHGISPITAAQMRGEPVTKRIGSLTLVLKPQVRRVVRELAALLGQWPQVLQFSSAVRNPINPGIDFAGTAALMSSFRAAQGQQPLTEYDVADLVGELVQGLDAFDAIICDSVWLLAKDHNPGVSWPRPEPTLPEAPVRPDIAEDQEGQEDGETLLADYAVALEAYAEATEQAILAAQETPAPEGTVWLDDLLLDNLEIEDYSDLLRELKACGGGYRGDLSQRFFRGSDGECAEPRA